jgi:hypothetical protein
MSTRPAGYQGEVSAEHSRFPVLRFMGALKAARDFGLEPEPAEAIALRLDPRAGVEHLVDALAAALVDGGAVRVPDAPR